MTNVKTGLDRLSLHTASACRDSFQLRNASTRCNDQLSWKRTALVLKQRQRHKGWPQAWFENRRCGRTGTWGGFAKHKRLDATTCPSSATDHRCGLGFETECERYNHGPDLSDQWLHIETICVASQCWEPLVSPPDLLQASKCTSIRMFCSDRTSAVVQYLPSPSFGSHSWHLRYNIDVKTAGKPRKKKQVAIVQTVWTIEFLAGTYSRSQSLKRFERLGFLQSRKCSNYLEDSNSCDADINLNRSNVLNDRDSHRIRILLTI